MVKTFVYAKADGTVATRNVFVIAEDKDYIRGLDMDRLDDKQKTAVTVALKDHKVSTVVSFAKGTKPTEIKGFDKNWDVAWRTFKKSNIKTDKKN